MPYDLPGPFHPSACGDARAYFPKVSDEARRGLVGSGLRHEDDEAVKTGDPRLSLFLKKERIWHEMLVL
jgi:hypothetical protein